MDEVDGPYAIDPAASLAIFGAEEGAPGQAQGGGRISWLQVVSLAQPHGCVRDAHLAQGLWRCPACNARLCLGANCVRCAAGEGPAGPAGAPAATAAAEAGAAPAYLPAGVDWVHDGTFEALVLDKGTNVLLGVGVVESHEALCRTLAALQRLTAGAAPAGLRIAYADAERLDVRRRGFLGRPVPRLYFFPAQRPTLLPVPDVPFRGLTGCTTTAFQGKVLVLGGHRGGRAINNKLEVWDPELRAWSAPQPQGRAWRVLAWHTAVLFPPNRLLLYGGEHFGLVSGELQQLSIGDEGGWKKLPLVTQSVFWRDGARGEHGAGARWRVATIGRAGGEVHGAGPFHLGSPAALSYAVVYGGLLKPGESGTVLVTKAPPQQRFEAGPPQNGIASAWKSGGDPLAAFDVSPDLVWKWHEPLKDDDQGPGARSRHSAVALGPRMYVFGGKDRQYQPCDPSVFALDTVTFKWHKVTVCPSVRHRVWHCVCQGQTYTQNTHPHPRTRRITWVLASGSSSLLANAEGWGRGVRSNTSAQGTHRAPTKGHKCLAVSPQSQDLGDIDPAKATTTKLTAPPAKFVFRVVLQWP